MRSFKCPTVSTRVQSVMSMRAFTRYVDWWGSRNMKREGRVQPGYLVTTCALNMREGTRLNQLPPVSTCARVPCTGLANCTCPPCLAEYQRQLHDELGYQPPPSVEAPR